VIIGVGLKSEEADEVEEPLPDHVVDEEGAGDDEHGREDNDGGAVQVRGVWPADLINFCLDSDQKVGERRVVDGAEAEPQAEEADTALDAVFDEIGILSEDVLAQFPASECEDNEDRDGGCLADLQSLIPLVDCGRHQLRGEASEIRLCHIVSGPGVASSHQCRRGPTLS
jgi:hypothetical protein